MKTILLSGVTAICVAVGFSSFRNDRTIDYYWSQLFSDISVGSSALYVDNFYLWGCPYVTFTPDPPFDPCDGVNFYCLAGFTSAQMTANKLHIKTSAGPIIPGAGVA